MSRLGGKRLLATTGIQRQQTTETQRQHPGERDQRPLAGGGRQTRGHALRLLIAHHYRHDDHARRLNLGLGRWRELRGEAILGYLEMGASGVQLGTRFVCATESIAHPKFKQAFIRASGSRIWTARRRSSASARAASLAIRL